MKKSVDVNDFMVKHPVLVTPDTELFEAIHKILRYKLSGVTVIDDERHPVGMLSELDCLRAILSDTYYAEGAGNIRVADHMTPKVEIVDAHSNVIGVARSMLAATKNSPAWAACGSAGAVAGGGGTGRPVMDA